MIEVGSESEGENRETGQGEVGSVGVASIATKKVIPGMQRRMERNRGDCVAGPEEGEGSREEAGNTESVRVV